MYLKTEPFVICNYHFQLTLFGYTRTNEHLPFIILKPSMSCRYYKEQMFCIINKVISLNSIMQTVKVILFNIKKTCRLHQSSSKLLLMYLVVLRFFRSWLIRIYTVCHTTYAVLHSLVDMKMTCFHLLKVASDGNFYYFLEKTTSI